MVAEKPIKYLTFAITSFLICLFVCLERAQIRGDYIKAEEHCGIAILTDPSDENYLSLYADLKWEIHRDSDRAERYYDQAVKASPDDWCVFLLSIL